MNVRSAVPAAPVIACSMAAARHDSATKLVQQKNCLAWHTIDLA